MTALVGYVDAGVGYIAADRGMLFGEQAMVTGCVKIVSHSDPTRPIRFSAAGAPLLAYPAQQLDPPVDDSGRPVAPGAAWSDAYMRSVLELANPPVDSDGDLDGNLMVLTPGAVTVIGASSWPIPCPAQGIALGTAGDLALGAFHGLRDADPGLPIEEALARAIAIACALSTAAAGGADVACL